MNKRTRKKKKILRLLATAALKVEALDVSEANMLFVTVDSDIVPPDELYEFHKEFQKQVHTVFPNVSIISAIEGINIKQQDTAIAEWIPEVDAWRCSNCGAVLEEDYNWHYHQFCYHCGCLMKHNYK